MNELSLFSGGGGGLLATLLLGWRPVGYVEWDDYCQRIIAARIRDGYLPAAPIFGDVRAFIRDGYAASYSGLVDVVTAGFPCQPFSVAGNMAAGDDPRNGWPATIDVVRIVRPRWIWLENVPGLITGDHGYFREILTDLSLCGYSVRWRRLSAAELGAPHLRDRVWIVAHADRLNDDTGGYCASEILWNRSEKTDLSGCEALAYANGRQCERGSFQSECAQSAPRSGFWTGISENPNADSGRQQASQDIPNGDRSLLSRTNIAGLHRATYWQGGSPVEPAIQRVADGVSDWVDRLRTIGNGQVPAVAAAAWLLLTAV